MASSRSVVLRVLVAVAVVAAAGAPRLAVADSPPLQDICVADLRAATAVDGFPCKPTASVVSDDFFCDAIVQAPSTSNPFGVNSTRATVSAFVLSGEVMVGFTTAANRLFSKVVREKELFVVPRGLQHFQLNVGAGNASFVAMFDSQSPGLVTPTFALFATQPAMPMEVLAKTFLMDEDEVGAIKSKFAGF
uniref:Germin-like protein n=1 Tax=Oryza barthii TaxID=65489 RepID=A0A0D3ET10_9ORYZ